MADQLELKGEQVVKADWKNRFSIEDGVRHIEQGRREGDKVVLTTHFHLEPGDRPKIIRTLAYDSETDECLVEVGTLSEEGKRVIAEEEITGRRSSATTVLRAEGQA